MRVCILGSGLQGRIVARDLSQNKHQVTILDNSKENLHKVDKSPNIKIKQFDVAKQRELVKFIKRFDVIVGALPAALGFYSMQCAVKAGVDMVDLSYSGEDPSLLDKQAKRKKIKIVPDAGFAPGLSNILVGEAYREFNEDISHRGAERTEENLKENLCVLRGSVANSIDVIRILVGGMPKNPIPPFNYRCTWSPADLIEEYTRPSRIIRNSKVVKVEALSGIGEIDCNAVILRTKSEGSQRFFAPLRMTCSKLEAFYTDGLRTLLTTIKNVKNMEEKTIRYAGHAELLKSLIEYRFRPDSKNPFTNPKTKPAQYVLDFLQAQLNQGDNKDLAILIIEVKSRNRTRKYTCIDYYDEKNNITSMARMTAYTGSIITQCIKDYPRYGIIPPEYLGMNTKVCNYVKSELSKRNVKIRISNFS